MSIHLEESKSNNETSRGSSLIEVMVAILIISLAMSPALYGAISALKIGTSIRNNLVAAHLAEEGVEVTRAIRDANWFNGAPFNAGLPAGSFEVQWDSAALLGNNSTLFLKSTGGAYAPGVYNYASGELTPFRRNIVIANFPSCICPPGIPMGLKVVSTVTWTEGSQNKSLSVESYLFDWNF